MLFPKLKIHVQETLCHSRPQEEAISSCFSVKIPGTHAYRRLPPTSMCTNTSDMELHTCCGQVSTGNRYLNNLPPSKHLLGVCCGRQGWESEQVAEQVAACSPTALFTQRQVERIQCIDTWLRLSEPHSTASLLATWPIVLFRTR